MAWMISTRRIEVEAAWLSHSVDTLELWWRRSVYDQLSNAVMMALSRDEELSSVDFSIVVLRGSPGDAEGAESGAYWRRTEA
jgi:hypothetical protein